MSYQSAKLYEKIIISQKNISRCAIYCQFMYILGKHDVSFKLFTYATFGDSATLISIVVGGGTGAASTVHLALLSFIALSAM